MSRFHCLPCADPDCLEIFNRAEARLSLDANATMEKPADTRDTADSAAAAAVAKHAKDEASPSPTSTPAKKPRIGSSPRAGSSPAEVAASPGSAPFVADLIPEDTIEADDAASDAGYESDSASRASTSICSTVRDYEFENNRRYHRFQEGRYQFPNDEPEQEREDMKHAMIVHLCQGKLHYAPLESPQKILDVGTGTGIWAIDSKRLSFIVWRSVCANSCLLVFPTSGLGKRAHNMTSHN